MGVLTKHKDSKSPDLLRGDASVAKVMQFHIQALQAPRGGLQVFGQDLLKLPGYGGDRDWIPHLDEHGLQPERG